MALANYTDLQASVAAWMNRSDLTALIPDFIAIAEARIQDDLRVRQMITEVNLNTVIATQKIALPADWLEFKSVVYAGDPMEYMPLDRIKEYADETGRSDPLGYSIEGLNLIVAPTPATVYAIATTYYAKVPAIATASTNWLLTKYPNIYLYGSLVSANQYTMDMQKADYWGGLYTQAIAVASGSNDRALSSGSPLRIRTR